jgi:hypothetical protein
MSGGHWDYKQFEVRDGLQMVGNDRQIIQKAPKIAQIYRSLATILEDNMHQMDYDLSGDSSIEDWKAFEKKFIEQLWKAIKQKYFVRIYEVKEEK